MYTLEDQIKTNALWKKAFLKMFYSTPKKYRTNAGELRIMRSEAKLMAMLYPNQITQ